MKRTLVSAVVFGLMSLPAFAEGLLVEQRAEVAVSVEMETGETVEELRPAELVRPGETVVFTVHFENQMAEAAENIVLEMPVPEEMVFVQGSADYEGVNTLHSVGDGVFHSWSDLIIEDETGSRSAGADDVRAIKWVFTDAVPANTVDEISFRAVLK